MFEVFNERTGAVVRRVRDAVKAGDMVDSFNEMYTYINNDKFDYRTVDENSDNDRQRRQAVQRGPRGAKAYA